MPRHDRLALALDAQALVLPDAGTVAVLNAAPSAFLDSLPPDRLRCEQGFRPTHDALAERGFAVAAKLGGPAAAVVVNLGRSRAESLGSIARALAMLPAGGQLAVNGAKADGVDAIVRQVDGAIPIDDTFVKAHGRVFRLRRPRRIPEAVIAWARAAVPSRNAAGFVTAPGMFSPEGPDPASALLAERLDPRLGGRVADLGGGWGWLAHAALRRCPGIAALDLHEADARSLDAARANVTDPRAAFHWSDVARLGADAARCDAVITNPPFHQGRAAEPDLGQAFIAAAARILRPAGRLWLVANRQLPYEAALDAAFAEHRRLHEDTRYKVILAERPRRR